MKKNSLTLKAIAIAATLLFCCGLISGCARNSDKTVDSSVILDVTPSIRIDLNADEEVVGVEALNAEAEKLLGDKTLEGEDMDTAVASLVDALVDAGYVTEDSNSILVSVSGNQKDIATEVREAINTELEKKSVSGSVITQSVDEKDTVKELADKLGVSVGKAQLITRIVSQNSLYTAEELAKLSVNELNLISESGSLVLEDVVVSGEAGKTKYIGEEAAKTTAFSYYGLDAASVTRVKCELDTENGHLVYEVDFDTVEYEYEVEINALTGTVEKAEKEQNDDYIKEQKNIEQKPEEKAETAYIGEAAAKEAALKHAGVAAADITKYEVELGHERGVVVYEIEFETADTEYDYDINAVTGAVVKYSKEKEESRIPAGKQEQSGTLIGEAKAKEIALQHAGVQESAVTGYVCKLDTDDGVKVYEIEFYAGEYEYDYEINATTGAVVKNEKEKEQGSGKQEQSGTLIGETKAKEIALQHAGVQESAVTGYVCKLDTDDGVKVYEIEFYAGEYEYDYEINATTGAVVKNEKEKEQGSGKQEQGSSLIGEASAKEIALQHAKVDASAVTNYTCKLDTDDGTQVYEIEFISNGYEYDYEINATTGKIIESDKEKV